MSFDPLPQLLSADGPLRSRKDLWTSLLLFLFCLLVYNADQLLIAGGDSYPARYLSLDAFSVVPESALLLYHNDLSASVPHFYWSEEIGHTPCLRLCFENTHRHSVGGVM